MTGAPAEASCRHQVCERAGLEGGDVAGGVPVPDRLALVVELVLGAEERGSTQFRRTGCFCARAVAGGRGRDDGRGGAGPLSRRPVHQNPPFCLYQKPAARLRLTEDVGMYKPTLLRTEEPGTTEVVAFLS